MKLSVSASLLGTLLFATFSAVAQEPPAPLPPPPADPAAPVGPAASPEPATPPPGEAPAELPPPPPPRQEVAPAPAQPAEPPPPPPRLINVETPPPAPPVNRTYHMHEGFYLRVSVGVGALNQSISTDSRALPDYSTSGGGLAYDIMIGGSPATGLAIGGAVMALGTTNADIEIDDEETRTEVDTSHAIIGVFIDGFPQPNGGLHLGGALGFAGDAIEWDGERTSLGGFGGAAWVGYGFWVGADWSLGGMLQFTGTLTRKEEDGLTQQASSFGTSLLFTALYH